MFGATRLQKALNGLSCAVLVIMLAAILLFVLGVFSNERYEYKIPKSELGVKFGYTIEPSLSEYELPEKAFSLELVKNEIPVSAFFETTNAKLSLVYDDDSHELLYLNASLFHSKEFDQDDLTGLYVVFESSVNEFVGL